MEAIIHNEFLSPPFFQRGTRIRTGSGREVRKKRCCVAVTSVLIPSSLPLGPPFLSR